MRSIAPLLVALAFALPATSSAQEEERAEKAERAKTNPQPDEVRAKNQAGAPGVIDPSGDAAGTSTNQVVTADGTGKEAPVAETNLNRFLSPVFSTKPHRLAPGQSGVLVAVLSLQGNAVIVPGAQVAVTYEPQQGELGLGQWSMLPAKPCTLYPKFKDQPLYEKYAQVEIPIAVAAGTKHGKLPVKLAMSIEISDGVSGEKVAAPRGEFSHEIVVGEPVPQPVPVQDQKIAPAATTGGPAARASEPAPNAAAKTGAEARKPTGLKAGEVATPQDVVGSEPAARENAGGYAESSDSDWILYGVLGVVGLGLLGIVIARLAKK